MPQEKRPTSKLEYIHFESINGKLSVSAKIEETSAKEFIDFMEIVLHDLKIKALSN